MAKQEEPFASVVLANRITNFREEEFIMASVSLQHIYKVYAGGVTAVSDFNLDIKDKEFIVLVGPSGCGKSTTLRMVAGRAGNDALGAFLGRKLADLIVSTAHLEAAGGLQVLGLQVELAVLGELGGLDEVGLAGNILEHESGMVNFIQSQHRSILSFVP